MITVMKKWQITVYFEDGVTTFFVSDNFYQNVLKKVAEIEWLKPVQKVTIEAAPAPTSNNATFMPGTIVQREF